MPTTVPGIQLQGSAPITSCMGGKPHLPVNVTFGLAPHSVVAPSTSKFVQKMQEHVKWAHKKDESFQAKETQCHKLNYDKKSKAVALEVGDMVLVHVTTFKGHHNIQNQWKNREYVGGSGPIPMYQCMWYAPGMGGAARPCIGSICYLSVPT